MKNLNFIFKLFLFPLLLILFTSQAFSEDENGNTCNEAQALLTGGLLAAADSGSSANGDKDYFSFTVASNGELNVTITNTNATASNAPKLEYSVLTLGSSPCVTASAGQVNAQFSNTQTIPITTAGTYYIFLEGTKNNPATTYDISALFTPHTSTGGIDLSISKIGSVDSLLIFDTFFYTINVSNLGDINASNVTVTDDLPSKMRVDIDATNADLASDGWECDGETITTICTLTGDLIPGSLSSIRLHVKAPPTDGNITNEVNVTSSADGIIIDTDLNPSNNQASEVTEVISDIDTAEHLCYDERTEILNAADFNTTCEKKGNFYYGSGCDAYVTIRENNITDILSSPKIYKMYADATSSGSCTYTAQGSTFGPESDNCNSVSNSNDYGSYQDGYAIIIDQNNTENLIVDIHDNDTDNNPRIDGIAMFGDYYYEVTVDGTLLSFHHFGRIFSCSGISEGGIEITTSADIIDTPIGLSTNSAIASNYNASVVPNPTPFDPTDGNIKYIQTMVAGTTTRNIEGVHLDLGGIATVYQYLGTEDEIPYQITPYLTNESCDNLFENIIDPTTNGQQLVIDVPSGSYSATGQMIVDEAVRKVARMQMIFIDPNALSPEGQNCLANSSTTGNFARLAQCVNSEVQYTTAFGQDAWDRCGEGNGNPCNSANHGYSCGEDNTICANYNPLYDNELGCYMCTFNIQPSCSTDNFAIRPDRFDANIVETYTPTHAPNLLRSGQDYNTSLTARNADDAVSSNYTVLNFHDIVDTPTPKKYFNTPAVPWEDEAGALMNGDALANALDPTHMVNGLSSSSISGSASAEPLVGVTFNDVGRVQIQIADVNWSQVDNDDTPMDCNSTEHTYICGELNVTFIPHHFSFAELNITNHAGPDSNLTYLANERGMPVNILDPNRSPMAARVHTRIEARNMQDNITQNFREDGAGVEQYYENNISVTQQIVIPTVRTLPSNPDAYIFGADANESEIDDKLVGFGRTGQDDLGTRNIKWDESTFPLEFNFRRDYDKPTNPFDVNGSYLSIRVDSQYIDPDDLDVADIDGSRIGDRNTSTCISPPDGSCVEQNADGNATFYYGKTQPSQDPYDDVMTDSVNTPILIKLYCNPILPVAAPVVCADYGIPITSQTNEYTWWLSPQHRMDEGHGNVELAVGTIDPAGGAATVTIAPSVTINANPNAEDPNVLVTAGINTPRPMTVNIDFVTNDAAANYTDLWLIYNQYSNSIPSPFYRVIFTGADDWAGHGTTGWVVGDDASTKKNKRLGW